MDPWVANWLAGALEFAGRLKERRPLYETLRRLWPDNELVALNAIASAAWNGEWDWYDDLVAQPHTQTFDWAIYRAVIEATREMRSGTSGQGVLRHAKMSSPKRASFHSPLS
jgi:hypothetical protein